MKIERWARVAVKATPDEDAEGVVSQNVADRAYKIGSEHWAARADDGLWYVLQGAGTRWDVIRPFTTEQMCRYFKSLRYPSGEIIAPLPGRTAELEDQLKAYQQVMWA